MKFKNNDSLKGKRIIITGAAGNLGSTFAYSLSKIGANLILIDKSKEALQSLNHDLSKASESEIEIFKCNLELEKERVAVYKKINRKFNDLDCLINNAAFVGNSNLDGWSVPFEKQSISSWRRALEVNLTAPFHLSQLFASMLKKNNGNIINITSIYGDFAPDWSLYEGTSLGNPAAYSVSKSGLNHLTKYLATVLAPNVRVNSISPGGIYRNQDKKFVKRYEKKVPLKRMATEDDLLGAVIYLASNQSEYVTGQILRVNGGWGI